MRWQERRPTHGDIRTVKRFAFLPVKIDGEFRWLEVVVIRQQFTEGYMTDWWDNKYFIDKDHE